MKRLALVLLFVFSLFGIAIFASQAYAEPEDVSAWEWHQFNVHNVDWRDFQMMDGSWTYHIDPNDPNPFRAADNNTWYLILQGWSQWSDNVNLTYMAVSFGTEAYFYTPSTTNGWSSTPTSAQICTAHLPTPFARMYNFSYGRIPAIMPMPTTYQSDSVICARLGTDYAGSTGQRYIVLDESKLCGDADENGVFHCFDNLLATEWPMLQYSKAEMAQLIDDSWLPIDPPPPPSCPEGYKWNETAQMCMLDTYIPFVTK